MTFKLTIELKNLEQAQVVADALELYSRMGLGQLGYIEDLIRFEVIPRGPQSGDCLDLNQIEALLWQVKRELGFRPNQNWSIGSDNVPVQAKRAYEALRVLRKALAEHREPSPKFKGVDYDGVIVRHTQDELPTASISL